MKPLAILALILASLLMLFILVTGYLLITDLGRGLQQGCRQYPSALTCRGGG